MYTMKPNAYARRQLNKHATTVIIGGLFLFLSVLLYLSLCTSPCEYETIQHKRAQELALHEGHMPESWPSFPRRNKKTLEAFLVIIILTGPKNYRERAAVRETWLFNYNLSEDEKVLPYFVIGTKSLTAEEVGTLEYENSTHNDLLLLPHLTDSYYALTEKVLQAYTWVNKNINFKFLFKGDDDTFARLDMLLRELRNTKAEKLYWGFFDGRARVKKRGKWSEKEWILCDTYVPHALGGGYLLSADLVDYIAQNAQILKKFNSEDISVGTWLGPLDINRKHDTRFDTEYRSRGCHNDYLVTHKQDITLMKEKLKTIKETGKLCHNEYRLRLSYVYDWDERPSLCCIRNDSKVP